MAKGNLILGTGSGSIGDVTMMRRNGAEVARVRIRKIMNPKSQGQAEQRMYMAPILKFYSPLAGVLETSFEGLNKSDSYAKFISVNANLARANGWAVKKGVGLFPLPYQIAGGTMQEPVMDGIALTITAASVPATLGELSAAIIAAHPNLQNGDQLTYIGFGIAEGATADNPKFIMKYGSFFLETASTDTIPADLEIVNGTLKVKSLAFAAAFIFSRWDATSQKWSRSNSFVAVDATYNDWYKGADVLAAAIASYMKSAGQVPVSDVYLNGGF